MYFFYIQTQLLLPLGLFALFMHLKTIFPAVPELKALRQNYFSGKRSLGINPFQNKAGLERKIKMDGWILPS